MTPEPRTCCAVLEDGSICQEKAIVLAVQYYYNQRPGQAVPAIHVLREAHYRIHCPKCGDRLQIEKAR